MRFSINEFVNTMDFELIKNNDDTISLLDLTSANLNNIQADKFELFNNPHLATQIIDRLAMYINDYYLDYYRNILYMHKISINYFDNYEDYKKVMYEYKELFSKYDLKIIKALCKPDKYFILTEDK